MVVLYLANYQGSAVLAQRGHKGTRALGAGRKMELLARGLGARGHEVHLVSAGTVRESTGRWYPGFACREPECGSARVTYLPGLDVPRLNLLVGAAMLRRFLRRAGRVDVVFLYNLEWYFLEASLGYVRATGTPLVIEYEDDAMADVGVRLKRWHLARGRRALAVARKEARGVLAASPELARQIGIPNSVVLPGIVGDDILSIPRERPVPGAPLRLVYSGGMTHEKGPDLLVAAAKLARTPLELDIVGAGVELGRIREQAGPLADRVRVHGEVSREELHGILSRADLAVNPHRMNPDRLGQIFPFKMVDYIGAGLPVVTSRLGEFPLPGKDSLVVYQEDTPSCLAEAIDRAAGGLAPLRAAAVQARQWVADEYSSAAAARKAEAVFLAAGPGGSAEAPPA